MINFRKNSDIRYALKNLIEDEDLISAIFEDYPNLKSIDFTKSNEYDDSNYYDSCELTAINGHHWNNCEDTYEYEHDDEDSTEERIIDIDVIAACKDLIDHIGKDFEYGEHTILRENHPVKKRTDKKQNSLKKYISAYLSGNKLNDEKIFAHLDPIWSVYYAQDFGRLPEEVEHKVFAKKGNMEQAYLYAVHVLKGRLPDNIENFYVLNTMNGKNESDKKWLVRYIEFKDALNKREN